MGALHSKERERERERHSGEERKGWPVNIVVRADNGLADELDFPFLLFLLFYCPLLMMLKGQPLLPCNNSPVIEGGEGLNHRQGWMGGWVENHYGKGNVKRGKTGRA